MDNYITVLIIIGAVSSVALILLSIIFLVFVLRNNHKNKHFDVETSPVTVDNCLKIISSSSKGQVIAASFLSLISLSYILIHILINEGEKYSDTVQKKDYCNSLSSDLIERINSVEGKYE